MATNPHHFNSSADEAITSLKIISLNAHGFRQCIPALTAFCNKDEFNIDIIFLQELWLSPICFIKLNIFLKTMFVMVCLPWTKQ